MTVKEAVWDLIGRGFEKSKPVKVWYVSDFVLNGLNNSFRRDSKIYGPSSILKNANPYSI